MTLTVEPVGPRQYKVSGPDSVHWVALGHWDIPPCDCEDHLWRDRVCKHMKAVYAYESSHE